MAKPVTPVIVSTRGVQTAEYPWATGVQTDRKGNLKIMQGWRQRAFHPAGEWASYTLSAAPQTRGNQAASR